MIGAVDFGLYDLTKNISGAGQATVDLAVVRSIERKIDLEGERHLVFPLEMDEEADMPPPMARGMDGCDWKIAPVSNFEPTQVAFSYAAIHR